MRFLGLLLFAAILAGCRTSTDGKKHHYLLENRRSMDFLKETFREGHAHDKREMRTDTNFKKFNKFNLWNQRVSRKFLGKSLVDSEWLHTTETWKRMGAELRSEDNNIRNAWVSGFTDD